MRNSLDVMFHGKKIDIIKGIDGYYWIPVKQICDDIGIKFETQRLKLKGHDVIISAPLKGGAGGQIRELLCIRKDHLGFWLATINTKWVASEEIRQKLITYQREICQVIDDYLSGNLSPAYYQSGHIFRSELLSFCESDRMMHEAAVNVFDILDRCAPLGSPGMLDKKGRIKNKLKRARWVHGGKFYYFDNCQLKFNFYI